MSTICDVRSSSIRSVVQIRVLGRFDVAFEKTPDKVAYGMREVEYCCDQQAVEVLLLSDLLFRGKSYPVRKACVGGRGGGGGGEAEEWRVDPVSPVGQVGHAG